MPGEDEKKIVLLIVDLAAWKFVPIPRLSGVHKRSPRVTRYYFTICLNIGIFYARVRAYDKVPSDSNFIDTDAEINSADMGAADNLKNEWPIYRCRVIHHLEFIIQQ